MLRKPWEMPPEKPLPDSVCAALPGRLIAEVPWENIAKGLRFSFGRLRRALGCKSLDGGLWIGVCAVLVLEGGVGGEVLRMRNGFL